MLLLSSILRRRHPAFTASQKTNRARRQKFRARLELLEDRSLLAGEGFWISGGEPVYESGGSVEFTVGCSAYREEPMTVEYRTAAGSADDQDYMPLSGVLTFAPGSGSAVSVVVPIIDDVFAEDDETFYLELFNAVNAPLSMSQWETTIRGNDRAPVLEAIADQVVDEMTELVFGASAYDPDEPAETLTYSLDAGAPAGAMIDPGSGLFSWVPQEVHGPGIFQVTVRVTESGSLGLSAAQTLSITVNEVNEAPTTSGLADINVNEDAANTILDVRSAFDDAEDGPGGLSYVVVANDNPGLLSSVSMDPATGQLSLAYARNAFGFTSITIRATDSGGLTVETTLNVNVESVNDAPVIAGFRVTKSPRHTWIISGSVTDVDEEVSGWAVSFGGVLAGYTIDATLDADGSFNIEVALPGIPSGEATAWVVDLDGLQSNIARSIVYA